MDECQLFTSAAAETPLSRTVPNNITLGRASQGQPLARKALPMTTEYHGYSEGVLAAMGEIITEHTGYPDTRALCFELLNHLVATKRIAPITVAQPLAQATLTRATVTRGDFISLQEEVEHIRIYLGNRISRIENIFDWDQINDCT